MNEQFKKLLELNMEHIEEKPLTEQQKQMIRDTIPTKRKRLPLWTKMLTAAAVGIIAISGSVYALPTIASQVPFIENIMAKVDPSFIPSNYNELATIINQVEHDNGIDIMIENAVFDGSTLMISYAIQTTQDLGESLDTVQLPDIKGSTSASGMSSLEKVDEHLYTGIVKVTPYFAKNTPETLQVKWEPLEVSNRAQNITITGDWSFAFTMDALPTHTQKIEQGATFENVQIDITQIDFTQLATVVHYEFLIDKAVIKEHPLSLLEIIKVEDNSGRQYDIRDNGGIISEDGHGYDWSFAIYDTLEDVTSLTFTAEMYYLKGSGEVTDEMREVLTPFTVELTK